MQYALDEYSDLHTIEFGPGGVLTKLMKRIQKGVPGEQIFDTKTLEAYKASQ